MSIYTIWTIARYEAKILTRSWAFRIFSIVALTLVTFMTIGLTTGLGRTPHYMHSLASSIPSIVIKLLVVYQGVITVFLASDWYKRDRVHDTTQVVYVRSMSNAQYVIGKVFGLVIALGILNIVGLGIALIVHAFFSLTPFAWSPYIYYSLLITTPTVVFAIGATFLAMNILRSQALVFVAGLCVSLVSVIISGEHFFHLFDLFAFHTPLVYSQIAGFGNLDDLLKLRGSHFLMGTGLILISILFVRRLRQAKLLNILAVFAGTASIILSIFLGYDYLKSKYDEREYRQLLSNKSQEAADEPATSMIHCDIELTMGQGGIDSRAVLSLENRTGASLDSILLTLNPGLELTSALYEGSDCKYSGDYQFIRLYPETPFAAGDTATVELIYNGVIDESYCYLDISQERLEATFSLWIFKIPKRYAFTDPDYLLLTSEAGWYPTPGVPGGPAYPQTGDFHFTDYNLTVNTPKGLTAISQGGFTVDTLESGLRYSFTNEVNLPRISLTVGKYRTNTVVVDSNTYSLYTAVAHEYLSEHFDSVSDTLPQLIRDLKDEYEIRLGLQYPYDKFSIVEIPVQFHTYRRFWTSTQEVVQPQIVLIHENGTLSSGADFNQQSRMADFRQQRVNQEESPEEIQASYLKTFVRTELFGTQTNMFGPREDQDYDADFNILPNYLTYSTRLTSAEWPVLGTTLELYLQSKIETEERMRFRFGQGLTSEEEVNLKLQKQPFVELLDEIHEHDLLKSLLQTKSEQLFSMMGVYIGQELFHLRLKDFLESHRHQQADMREFITALVPEDTSYIISAIDRWYTGTEMPGFIISNIQAYDLVENQRTVSQVKFTIANPVDVDGIVTVNVRTRQGRGGFGFPGADRSSGAVNPWWSESSTGEDFERTLLVPAGSELDAGFVLGDPPANVSIDTHVSKNLPSVMRKHFRNVEKNEKGVPVDTIELHEFVQTHSEEEYIVDNEDEGFSIVNQPKPNMLRRLILSLFEEDESDQEYSEIRFWSPPSYWQTAAREEFYGKFIHSGVYKKSGSGENVVAWQTELDEGADYDVYFYYENLEMPPWFRRRGDRQEDKGSRSFLIYYEDGVDEITYDLNIADEGWNLIGTYRCTAGPNKIQLTDESDATMVIADAVKWVRR